VRWQAQRDTALDRSEFKPKAPSPLRSAGALQIRFPPALYFSLLPSYFCFMPKCPTCAKQIEWQDNPWRPFCSERCKLIDFSRWANEEYRVPGKEINPDEIVDHPAAGDSKSADDIEA
jgi:endogenous inhibitor of DNA gyrase (YacG/DUF329 family)